MNLLLRVLTVVACALLFSFIPFDFLHAKSAIVQRDKTPVLFKPERNSLRLFRLKQYDVVRILDEKTDWYYIEFDTVDATLKGWIRKSWVTPPPDGASTRAGQTSDQVPPSIYDELSRLPAPSAGTEEEHERWSLTPFHVAVFPTFVRHETQIVHGTTGELRFDRPMEGAGLHLSWLPLIVSGRPGQGSFLLGTDLALHFLLIDSKISASAITLAPGADTLSGTQILAHPKLTLQWTFLHNACARAHLGMLYHATSFDTPTPKAEGNQPIFTEKTALLTSLGASGEYEIRHPIFSFIFDGAFTLYPPLGSVSETPAGQTGATASPGFGFDISFGLHWRAKPLYPPLTFGVAFQYESLTTQFQGQGTRADKQFQDAELSETEMFLTIPIGLTF